jgi:hypothetical protein
MQGTMRHRVSGLEFGTSYGGLGRAYTWLVAYKLGAPLIVILTQCATGRGSGNVT